MGARIVLITRDDERPVSENMVIRSELLAGFVVTFDGRAAGWEGRLQIRCGICDGYAIEDPDCYFSSGSGSLGPVPCRSCEKYALVVNFSPSESDPTVEVVAVSIAAGVPGTVINRDGFALELS